MTGGSTAPRTGNSTRPRACDVPEIRAELAAWLAEEGAAHWGRSFVGLGTAGLPREYSADPYGSAAALAHRAAMGLRAAEMYYVAADLTELAVAAGRKLPAYRLHHHELPAECGLLVWEVPCSVYEVGPLRVPVRAVSWSPHGPGTEVIHWGLTDERVSEQERLSDTPANHLRAQLPALERIASSFLPYGRLPHWLAATEWEDSRGHQWHAGVERTLMATWLLMGQTLTRESPAQAPRSALRRIRRHDPTTPTSIRYVQLRHATSDPQPPPVPDRRRNYHHRWLVRGHWRNQWLPSRQGHRPVWVSPHVRGPLGAPLLGGERVNVLRR
ncbi:hypothetical protein [Streptomyces sp. WZ-12]|uniref:hypothetical protein n=1 Tax=Streptomyces sp. WZ-12 TaxID=3030210 RepID=UPI0023812E94|nr:hypothetical protein [Streptomyces sp. WZ-12]